MERQREAGVYGVDVTRRRSARHGVLRPSVRVVRSQRAPSGGDAHQPQASGRHAEGRGDPDRELQKERTLGTQTIANGYTPCVSFVSCLPRVRSSDRAFEASRPASSREAACDGDRHGRRYVPGLKARVVLPAGCLCATASSIKNTNQNHISYSSPSWVTARDRAACFCHGCLVGRAYVFCMSYRL